MFSGIGDRLFGQNRSDGFRDVLGDVETFSGGPGDIVFTQRFATPQQKASTTTRVPPGKDIAASIAHHPGP